MPGTLDTWKLRVRLLVREGRWSDAWAIAMNGKDDWVGWRYASDGVPLPVWIELLGTPKKRGQSRRHGQGDAKPTKVADSMQSLARYNLVMRQRPKLTMESGSPPPRVVYASVEALLHMGERQVAQQMTTHFLNLLPEGIALRLVHLHLGVRPTTRGLNTYYQALRELRAFLLIRPTLRPNATTLFVLLGHLRRAEQGGTIGDKLARAYRRRWGEKTWSPQVCRRLLTLAMKEGRQDLVRVLLLAGRVAQDAKLFHAKEKEVLGGLPRKYRTLIMPSMTRVFSERGTERVRWDKTAIRAGRVCASGIADTN